MSIQNESIEQLRAQRAELLAAVKALLAAADHTLPASWRKDRPVSFAKAIIVIVEGPPNESRQ